MVMSDTNSKKISIVIPVYNEEEGIQITLQKLISLNLSDLCEIIVVDDGSTDGTTHIVKQFPVKILSHNVNKGYGAALKTGIRKAVGGRVVILDGDAQHNPEDIEGMIELLKKNDMVIGQRTTDSFQLKHRDFGKKIIRFIGEYLVEQKLLDFNSGFRGFDRKIVRSLLHLMPNGFSFSTTSTLAFIKEGYSVSYYPIVNNQRIGRKSNVKFFQDGIKTMLLILRVIMLFNPLKVFMPTSIIISLVGIAYTIYHLIVHGGVPNPGVICLLSGVIIFFFGLLSDQVAALRRQNNND